MDNAAKQIEIFKAGTHTDSSGRTLAFPPETVAAIARAYDPARFAAPIVVGHPKTADPAFGWIKALKLRDDGILVAATEKVAPEFADAVKAGRYRKISASFYLPDHPENPVPGQYYLRHVGFLGAAAPAVKGLAPAELAACNLADADSALIATIEFADIDAAIISKTLARLFRSLRDLFVERFGKDEAERAVPSDAVDSLEQAAADQLAAVRAAPDGPGFAAGGLDFSELTDILNRAIAARTDDKTSRADIVKRLADAAGIEPGTVNQILSGSIKGNAQDPVLRAMAKTLGLTLKTLQNTFPKTTDNAEEAQLSSEEKERLAALETENAALKRDVASFTEAQAKARQAGDQSFIDGLITAGKLAPGVKADVLAFMETLEVEQPVDFAESKKTPHAFFRELLGKSGQVIDLAERSAPDGKGADKSQSLSERQKAHFKKEA